MKGTPPCLGVGLRAVLAKHVPVICTPEHHTSATCSYCEHRCHAVEEVDQRCRSKRREALEKRLENVEVALKHLELHGCDEEHPKWKKKSTEKKQLKSALHWAARFSKRSLRRCSNVECRRVLNRDRNAAVNIGRRCDRLIRQFDVCIHDGLDEDERAIATLEHEALAMRGNASAE